MKRENLLDLNEALQHPGKKLVFPINTELETEEDLDLLEPVTGQIEGVSTGNLLFLESHLMTRLVTECARCGTPIELDIDFEMTDNFDVDGIPSSYASDSHAHIVEDEPFPLFKGNSLMRDEYVRQGLLLNVPMQPLCTGSWDIPCPEAPVIEEPPAAEPGAGHPALQALNKLKDPEDSP
jgi:uncharacterized protein